MHDLPEYLTQLVGENETVLFVRQKPKKGADGDLLFHGDGAIVATWPAYLPSEYERKAKPGQAWYGNTAVYIIDRFENGQPSASRAYCEHVAVMVLDDIGTKSKTPPLEPTWKVETSPGNFQWGYAFDFDHQPKKGEFSAAIKAIAGAGYTDPGAINPVRNFRLPGSVNLKPAHNGFAAVLSEFHPERTFTLAQICQALEVVPGEPTQEYRAIRGIKDDGTDDVLAWLVAQGQVIEARNTEGWYGVLCPNYEQHSDGSAGGRYNPATRAFMCFHGHCQGFGSAQYLEWIAHNGGPKREHGLREELLTVHMDRALSKLTPNEAFPDEAARIIKEVESKDLSRLEKSEWFDRFAYNPKDDAYFDLDTRQEFRRNAFNAMYRHVKCLSNHNGRRIEASVCFDENRRDRGGRILDGITYAAGEGPLVAYNGAVFGNLWRNARPDVSGVEMGDIGPWLRHAEALIPDSAEREHVFNVMAYKVQHPEAKINHAVLHVGKPGCGKDTLWAPMLWAIGGEGNLNRSLVDSDKIMNQWGYAFQTEVLILNELKETDASARRDLANRLKPVIAAPPETISVNRKNMHPYEALNRMFVLAFSNEQMPITLDSQDRRWFCIQSTTPILPEHEARAMWNWYQAGAFQQIAAWLYARDVSAFNPAATPMMTEFKASLIESGMSIAEAFVLDEIRHRRQEFARGAVGSPFFKICDSLQGRAPNGVKIVPAAVLHALQEAGWLDKGMLASADHPSKKRVYCAPEHARLIKSDLRRMVEDPIAPVLSVVKKG
jgi:hypothetical protein